MGFVTKVICWIQIFLMYISVLQGYDLLCPTALQWNIRALEKCHNKEIYFCLFDNLDNRYIEGCTGPNFDRSGNKQYYPRYFNREPCNGERFQPFKFWTNGSSDCVYLKTLCSGEGQVIYNNRTTTEDRTCGCDFKSGYAFVLPPENVCFCDPAVEDCACYLKPCPIMNVLSPDYKCVNDSFLATYVYLNKCAIPNSNNRSELNIHLNKSNIEGNVYSGRNEHLTVCLVITAMIAVSLSVAIGLSLYQRTDLGRMCKGKFCMTPEEKYFLRLTYLIMRVAYPVVRIKFDEEFHPSRLQEELVTIKMQILDLKRKKHINQTQWNQLYPREGPVTSRNFDIRLLLTLIRNRTRIIIGDELPLPLHKDVGDDLTRINYYRNKMMTNMNGKMSNHEFDDSWDTLSFSIVRLIGSKLLQSTVSTVGSNTIYREEQNSEQHNQHGTNDLARLKATVYSLHTFHLEDDRCYKLLSLLYKWTAMIVNDIINEYCYSRNKSLENLLNNNRHDLYHKRRKFFKCSDCENRVFNKVFTENQWNSLYEVNNEVLLHHNHTEKEREYCPEVFTSKSNLSLSENNISLLLLLMSHIKDLSCYVFTRMETERFEQYLLQHRHKLFHGWNQQQCCECKSTPDVKNKFITVEEWNILFSTKVESELPHCMSDMCSCKYVPVKQLRITDLNIELLNNIGYISDCLDVLGNLRNKVFSKALSGIMDEKTFETLWEESTKVVFTYLNIIVDEKRKNSLKTSIKYLKTCKVNPQMWIEYSGCIQDWIRHDIDLKQPINEMLTFMKIVLPGIGTNAQKTPTTRTFFVQSCRNPLNITAEETNYLRVVHLLFGLGLTALRVKFDSEFPPQELPNKLCNRVEDLLKLRQQGVIFPSQWEIMFPAKGIASSKQFDFSLMVSLLEHLAKITVLKDQPDYDNVQTGADLYRLINFRREIMHSINGTLTNEEFDYRWSQICPAIVRLGGKEFKNICSNLEMTKKFLDT